MSAGTTAAAGAFPEAVLALLRVSRVVHGPADAFDQLCRRVIVLEVLADDGLIEQYGVLCMTPVTSCCYKDSRHIGSPTFRLIESASLPCVVVGLPTPTHPKKPRYPPSARSHVFERATITAAVKRAPPTHPRYPAAAGLFNSGAR
jgi:hypothetical protein